MADLERQAELLEAALTYAGRGLHIFPARGKAPLTEHGFHDASTDADTVLTWWQRWPSANIAMATGPVSGIDVLDVDVQHGGGRTLAQLEREHGKLPVTTEVLTPGGGRHLWFAHSSRPLKTGAGALGAGLDTRGEGGYVIVPPSIGANGRAYRFMRDAGKTALAEPPAWLLDRLEQASGRRNGAAPSVDGVIPVGQRRKQLLSLAGTLRRRGLGELEILAALSAVNEHRCKPPLEADELAELAHDVPRRYEPDAGAAIRTEARVEPGTLADVVTAFRRWLHVPDPGVIYAELATVAANRIPSFDPVWLLVVGPSGGGKTETLAAIGGLADVYAAATLTEASLLSGTSSREKAANAKGGLLRDVGDFGILTLKDFGSVLSMHRDARSAVLAALREIFDGEWTRHVGTDGGRTLHWTGKLGLIAGATPAIDQHHSVLAQLGERFVFYRLDVGDAATQARCSLRHQGREREMRKSLRDAVCSLFATIDLSSIPPVTETDENRLVALTTLVARARSPVVRDSYRRELELVPDAEAPGRLIGTLGRFLTGLRVIGADDDEAWRVVVKAGLNSMPATRRRTLAFLIDNPTPTTTTAVALDLGLPNPSTHRVLEELAAHGLLTRESQGQGKPDLWQIERWTAEQWAAATSSEMSEPHISIEPQHTFDDKSEEVARTGGEPS
jgi:hypothetical protein